jgi:hypothetical protein
MPENEKRKSNVGAALKKKRSWLVTWLSCGIFQNPEIKGNSNLLQRGNEKGKVSQKWARP